MSDPMGPAVELRTAAGRFELREGQECRLTWESRRGGLFASLVPARRNRARLRVDLLVDGGEDGARWLIAIPNGSSARLRINFPDILRVD